MTTSEFDPLQAPEPAGRTDVEGTGADAAALPDERPATSDPDQMVDTPDDLGGTGANAGGAG